MSGRNLLHGGEGDVEVEEEETMKPQVGGGIVLNLWERGSAASFASLSVYSLDVSFFVVPQSFQLNFLKILNAYMCVQTVPGTMTSIILINKFK